MSCMVSFTLVQCRHIQLVFRWLMDSSDRQKVKNHGITTSNPRSETWECVHLTSCPSLTLLPNIRCKNQSISSASRWTPPWTQSVLICHCQGETAEIISLTLLRRAVRPLPLLFHGGVLSHAQTYRFIISAEDWSVEILSYVVHLSPSVSCTNGVYVACRHQNIGLSNFFSSLFIYLFCLSKLYSIGFSFFEKLETYDFGHDFKRSTMCSTDLINFMRHQNLIKQKAPWEHDQIIMEEWRMKRQQRASHLSVNKKKRGKWSMI